MSLKSFGRWVAAFAGITTKRLERLAVAAALGLAACSAADPATAGQLFTGQFGTGNSWNIYEAINNPFTFKDALAFSLTRANPITGNTAVGNLVSLVSQEENDFVQMNAIGNRWIGYTDRGGVAAGASEGVFAWTSGEAVGFEAWGAGEPNNSTEEDGTHLNGAGVWNDHKSGYAENEPTADFDSGNETNVGGGYFPFVIEWRTNLAAMPTGFPMTRPDPPAGPRPPVPSQYPTPLARIPGPNGTATAFGVRDVTGVGTINGLQLALAALDPASGGIVTDGTAARFDIHDPNNGGNQGSVLGPQVPSPSEVPGVDDEDFASVVKGTFRVPQGGGGDYTFNVRSDDGFGMRIFSQATGGPLAQHKFTNSSGNGGVDMDGALVHPGDTGDSNTQGLINLAPGTYDVEFVVYERAGGAFWEVSTQKGDFVNPAPNTAGNWILLGDGSSKPQEGPFLQAARLTGNAAVKNYDFQTNVADTVSNFRTNPAPIAEGTFADVVLNGDGGLGIHGADAGAGRVHQFPNGVGQNNFTTAVTGQLQVLDTDGAAGETLTFGLFADDNAAVHITGQDFTSAGGGGTVLDVEGTGDNWLVADFRTGNTDAYGVINLAEGNYNFEAFQLEEGGGAALEVWVASGTRLGFSNALFFPLTTATLGSNTILAANQGLPLVLGPGTGPAGGQTGDFNGNGVVDAADYVLWRNGGPLQNDPTAGVQPADYDVWRANFGRTPGSGAGAAAAVPEATTLLSAAVALVFACVAARTRRS